MLNILIQIVAFLYSLLGYYYLNRQNRMGYFWFGLGNTMLIFNAVITKSYILIGMYIVWNLFNIDGFKKWSDKNKIK